MDYADEPYVRKYTRKTVTNRLLGWEGRAVLDAMLGEFDHSGVFDFRGDVVRAIWAVTDIPEDLVRVALARLIETETWVVNERSIVWPTLPEAQGCIRSDRLRQKASRAQRNSDSVTRGHGQSRPVTNGHAESQPVALGHTPSRTVTAGHSSLASLPSQASQAEQAEPPERAPEAPPAPAPEPLPESEPEPVTEPVPLPAPEPPRLRLVTNGDSWKSFPEGWRWSAETAAAATMAGVSTDELQEYVSWWTTHDFHHRVNNLDGELRRRLGHIRTHWETERAKAAQAAQGPPYRSRGSPADPNERLRVQAERIRMLQAAEAAEEARAARAAGGGP